MENDKDQPLLERGKVFLAPIGMRSLGGISSSYDDEFPWQLEGILEIEEFDSSIKNINTTLSSALLQLPLPPIPYLLLPLPALHFRVILLHHQPLHLRG